MVDLTVAMPPSLNRWIEAQIAGGAFVDAGDVVRSLVRTAWREQEIARVRALVDEGFASGIDDREPEDILREIMARVAG